MSNSTPKTPTTKQCGTCKKVKPLTDFSKKADNKGGLQSYCKQCKAAYDKNYQESKKKANMSELIRSKQIGEEFKLAAALVISYLEVAKIPAHKLVVGTEAMSLYDKAAAFKAVDARMKEEKAIAEANLARLEAAKIPTIKDVMALLKLIATDASDAAELAEDLKQLKEQNTIIFKTLTEMKTETQTRLANLHAVTVGQQAESKIPPAPQIREPLPSVSMLKIAIVGLHQGDHTALKNDFGDLFKLSLLTPDESRKITGLKNMDKTYLMTKYVGHKHMELLKSIGQTPVIVPGTVNDLKEALTALYLE